MCGRFARRSTQKLIANWFGVPIEELPVFGPTYNAAPQSFQPILRRSRDTGAKEIVLARWGLIPYWAKDEKVGYSTINARAEELLSKPLFRDAVKKRRCLVPADAFYEWQRIDAKTKHPFAIALRSGEPYAFAGLWERWKPKEGPPLESFTIITTDPNQVVESLHDRMPVIVEPRDYDRWLFSDNPDQPPVDLLRPYPAEKMHAWQVPDRVGNVRNDDPTLLDQAAPPPPEQPSLFA